MARMFLFAMVALLFAGCSNTYVLRMNNGAEVIADGRPRLDGSYYVFKDSTGRTNYISSGRVTSIEAK